jgi:hypothetical protein
MKRLIVLLALALTTVAVAQMQTTEGHRIGGPPVTIANMLKAAFGDSADAWWARTKVDSSKSDASSLAIGDVAALATRLDEKQTKAAFDDSLLAQLKRVFLPATSPLPTVPDSSLAVQDSVRVLPLFSSASAWLKKMYNHFFGLSAYGKVDTVTVATTMRLQAIPDSAVVAVRTVNKDSNFVDLTIKDDRDSTLVEETVAATADCTWVTLAFPIDPAVNFTLPRDVVIEARARVRSGQWIELTPVQFKGVE